jgi:hypothetical protein
MMLTTKERKKIKRIKKTEKQKEEQDKIRLGLIQAPGTQSKTLRFCCGPFLFPLIFAFNPTILLWSFPFPAYFRLFLDPSTYP